MRLMSRVLIAAAVVLTLTTVSVPTAHALPLGAGTEVFRMDVSWFQAALSWISHLLPMEDRGTVHNTAWSTAGTGTDSTKHVNTGSCIDPQGNPPPRCGGI